MQCCTLLDRGAKKQPYLTVEQFQNFLNCHQRDPRLNEILYPLTSSKQAEELMKLYETNSSMSGKGMEKFAFVFVI